MYCDKEEKMTVIEKIRSMSESEFVEAIFQLSKADEDIFNCHCQRLSECDPNGEECCPEERHRECIRAWLHSDANGM